MSFVTSALFLHVDCGYVKRKFYAACNAVLADCKYANEFVKLHLVKSYCLPLLTVLVRWICLVIKLKTLVYVGTILLGKSLVTIDGNLLLSFSIIVMRYLSSTFMIFANGTFYILSLIHI